MVSLEEIQKEIIELEKKDTCYAVCERLAWLYVVRDHLAPSKPQKPQDPATVATNGESDFLKACNGVEVEKVLPVLDELMDTINVMNPKAYKTIVDKIKSLR